VAGNKPSVSIKGGEILELAERLLAFQMDSTPWSWVVTESLIRPFLRKVVCNYFLITHFSRIVD
jgi:hypothetical protein